MKELIQEMIKVKRVPYLEYGLENLSLLTVNFAESAKSSSDKHILLFTGSPKVGKSHFRKRIEEFLISSGLSFQSVNWEEDGEARARKEGKIQTPPHQLLEDDQLEAANQSLERRTLEAIGQSDTVLIEIPGITAVKIGRSWIGRPLGSKLLHDLALKREAFLDLTPYQLYGVGLISGPSLRYVMAYLSDDMQSAQVLEEAQTLAVLYGKEPPATQQEWDRLKEGASVSEVIGVEEQMLQMIDRLSEWIKIDLPSERAFHRSYDSELKKLVNPDLMDKTYQVEPKVAGLMEWFFEERFRMNPDNVFIGRNDPRVSELGIKDVNKLRIHLEYIKYVRRRKGRLRFIL